MDMSDKVLPGDNREDEGYDGVPADLLEQRTEEFYLIAQ